MRWSLACCLLPTAVAWADAIVVTQAMKASTICEVFIEVDRVRAELEIGVQDLDAFRNLMPDALYERLGHDPRPLMERFPLFYTEDWVIRFDDGEPRVGRVDRIEPGKRIVRDEITGEPLAVQPEDAEVVVRVTLVYPFLDPPSELTLRPPTDAASGRVAASIGFVVYHGGVPVNDYRYLSGEEVLDLDWDDPWYSRFRNRNLRRQYDAPLSVFLYVEYFEIRKEIIVRPRDMQQWIDLELEGSDVIAVADQPALKQSIADFLAARGQVRVDGKPVKGELDRVHFVRRTLRRTGVVDPPEDLDLNSATLGVIFVYPRVGLPNEVTVDWDLFSPKIQQVASVATDEAGGLPFTLTPDDPVLRWQNFLTNPKIPAMMGVPPMRSALGLTVPLASAACGVIAAWLLWTALARGRQGRGLRGGSLAVGAVTLVLGMLTWPILRVSIPVPFTGAGRLSEPERREIVASLLHNVYRAFDRRSESTVYDSLALSISGDLLEEVYVQTYQSMVLEGQGGARVKIDEVEMLESVPVGAKEGDGFVQRCRWNATGSVGHWGHVHRRTNQYDAVLTISPVTGAWRISDIEVRGQIRVVPTDRNSTKSL